MSKKAKSKPAKVRVPSTVLELTNLWKDLEHLADDIGAGLDAVYSMRHRNRIDQRYWRPVVSSAKKRRIPGVDIDLLADIHAGKPVKKKAA